MNRLSDIVDNLDKALDIWDYMIDVQKRHIQLEIKWLSENYSNKEALRAYFSGMYDVGNIALKYQYLDQLSGYTMDKLQEMASIRANILYEQYSMSDMEKGNHSFLKPISELLRLMGN